MSRNNLKRFPTAILRRGMAHFHPLAPPNVFRTIADEPPTSPAEPATTSELATPPDPPES